MFRFRTHGCLPAFAISFAARLSLPMQLPLPQLSRTFPREVEAYKLRFCSSCPRAAPALSNLSTHV